MGYPAKHSALENYIRYREGNQWPGLFESKLVRNLPSALCDIGHVLSHYVGISMYCLHLLMLEDDEMQAVHG